MEELLCLNGSELRLNGSRLGHDAPHFGTRLANAGDGSKENPSPSGREQPRERDIDRGTKISPFELPALRLETVISSEFQVLSLSFAS